MVAPTRPGQYTYADYLQTPDDVRYELIDGELIMAAAAIPRHQRISMRFSLLLGPFIRSNGLGELFAAPTDVYLSDANVVQPDLLFVSAGRRDIIGDTNIRGAPDLVIEIASPATEEFDRTVKQDLYARYGVREYWRAHPVAETVEPLRLVNGQYVSGGILRRGDALTTPLLPGLAIELSEIFG